MIEGPVDRWWPLHGRGLANFGKAGEALVRERRAPDPGEIVATVEAATICASDAKMVRLGSEYPLFAGRDLAKDPVCLGHELALRVEESAIDHAPFAKGVRIGIQPDIYCRGQRMCLGVNIQGGFTDALVLGPEVMASDSGAMAFAVPAGVGRAATAMLEPLACIEAAFRLWGRTEIKRGGRLAVVCVTPDRPWKLDVPSSVASVSLFGITQAEFVRMAPDIDCAEITSRRGLPEKSPEEFDDLIVLGDVDEAVVGPLFDRLTSGATFTWLAPDAVAPTVKVDLAHFHYGKLTLRGAASLCLSDAAASAVRTDYRPGGTALVYGASGAMGRFHLVRAIEAGRGPQTIVALARRRGKLMELVEELAPLAERHGRTLHAVATEDADWRALLEKHSGGHGFDDVVVVAPGGEAMNEACRHVASDGLLIGFAGTRAGEFVDMPLARLATDGLSITASSGSTVDDQMRVVDGILDGTITPERHVAAVCGLGALHQGMEAVLEGRFSGKVLMLPGVDWPLTPIDRLLSRRNDLRELAQEGKYWSKEIEDAVLGPR